MNEKFLNYLKDIGISTQKLTNRIEELYQLCVGIVGHDFDDISIDDIVKKTRERDYVSMGFFSKDIIITINNIYEDTIDIIPVSILSQELSMITIKKESYDFIEANEDSRLLIELFWGIHSIESRATSKNCDYLKKIYERYFKPLIKK